MGEVFKLSHYIQNPDTFSISIFPIDISVVNKVKYEIIRQFLLPVTEHCSLLKLDSFNYALAINNDNKYAK